MKRMDRFWCKCGELYEPTYADYQDFVRVRATRQTLTRGFTMECAGCGIRFAFDFEQLSDEVVHALRGTNREITGRGSEQTKENQELREPLRATAIKEK